MGQLLVACQEVSGSDARFIWVAEEFLLEHGVGPWMDLPLWLPEIQPEYAGFFSTDFRKALRAGLTFRPLEETVRATLKWDATRPGDHPWRAGLTLERERALLDAWNNKR
jgi:2'-hydroxyisoflavone reductase